MSEAFDRAWARQRRTLVVDTHVHGRLLPDAVWKVYRAAQGRNRPPEVAFASLPACGVDAVVASAVGDALVTRWNRGAPMEAVRVQLERIRSEADEMHAVMATTAEEVRAAHDAGRTAVVLGVEGADMIGDDLAHLDRLHGWGVRHLGLVHFADNALGTICTPVSGILAGKGGGRPTTGLTEVGAQALARCGELGIVADLAHASDRMIDDVCAQATVPVVSTHTGARSVQDFARYLADEQVEAIAGTGGYVGLWPFRFRDLGCATVDDWVAHARHLVGLVGAAHVAIGTDMNGVPATMEGYRSELDFPVLTDALGRAGVDGDDLDLVLGGNALRVLEVTGAAANAPTMAS